MYALHEYGSPLHYHDGTRADDMVEGGQQGSVLVAAHLAALALQPVLQAADSKLKENGGCVLAIADDVYMLIPITSSLSSQNTVLLFFRLAGKQQY